MDHYVDIAISPSQEVGQNHLMSTLFNRLHQALVARGQEKIGVSFPSSVSSPQSPITLGNLLRLHGPFDLLRELMEVSWIGPLSDYVTISGIRKVPRNTKYRVVRRRQVKSSSDRIVRRALKRGLNPEEASALRSRISEQSLDLPFAQMRSQSTGQLFRLFIEHMPLSDCSEIGKFSAYGLSDSATVPWFEP